MKALTHYINCIKLLLVNSLLSNTIISSYLSRNHLRIFLSLYYYNWTNKKIDWQNPKDFNQWLLKCSLQSSLGPQKYDIARCADKFAVRDYVVEKGYGATLNELYFVFDNVSDIDFSLFPDGFVIKMNNASGRNLICADKNKICFEDEKRKFQQWMQDRSFGLSSGEWQYSLIEPRVIVEKYLDSLNELSLIDYKFNCINGKVFSCFVGYNRNPENPHGEVCFDDYDINWNRTEAIKPEWHKNRRMIDRPVNYDSMLKMAEDLSFGFHFCRVDLYEVDGCVYFGEMTFTPQGCVLEFYEDWYLKEALAFAERTSFC